MLEYGHYSQPLGFGTHVYRPKQAQVPQVTDPHPVLASLFLFSPLEQSGTECSTPILTWWWSELEAQFDDKICALGGHF